MKTGPNIRKRIDGRYEARYEKARNAAGRIIYGYCYGKTYEEAQAKRAAVLSTLSSSWAGPRVVRQMNLLILGADRQGEAIQKTAKALGAFRKISFLDNDPANRLALDLCANYEKYVDLCPIALPSFSDCHLRGEWIERLECAGFILPTLIHPSVWVGAGVSIEEGVFIDEHAVIHDGAHIRRGCVIGAGAAVGQNAVIGENVLLGDAAAVKDDADIPSFTVVSRGPAAE